MLSFLGPKEVLENQRFVLVGTYDPKRIATISLLGANQYALDVTLNPTLGIWYSAVDPGFGGAGVRQLILRGTNSNGILVNEVLVSVSVVVDGVTAGSLFTAITLRETLWKKSTADSASLSETEKVTLPAGQVLKVERYEWGQNHLKATLLQPLGTVGIEGYLFQPHIVLTQGSKVLTFDSKALPQTPPGTELLWITHPTIFKLLPQDSSRLSPNQQTPLYHGATFSILGHTSVDQHFRVTLTEELPGLGRMGYIYRHHASIFRQGQLIPYDDNAITVTILTTTPFKKQPIDSIALKETEKVTLRAGSIYGVSSYAIENGHLKVALTENIPNFGNTGYLFLNFVEMRRGGQLLNPAARLTYQGPREVLVNQPTVLQGNFNPVTTVNVTVMAEDRFPLTVQVSRWTGTWKVTLDQGFKAPGARWLRLRALDRQGQVIGSQVIHITVSADPLTVGDSLSLQVTRNTFFKASPIDSSLLNQEQKVLVSSGQTFGVSRYGFVDGHLKVVLQNPIEPIGTFGYLYEGHVQLNKGDQVLRFSLAGVPDTHVTAQMLVVRTTKIKARPEDSVGLNANQVADLILGQTFAITGYASVDGHFRVTLADSIAGFGNVGYIYWEHVQIKKDNEVIRYNPNAILMTIRQTTVLKKRPVDTAQLSDADKVTVPLGRVYEIRSYSVENNHVKVSLTEEFPGFGNTGFIFPAFALFQRGGTVFDPIPDQVELNVPYFSQRDNPRFYWSTCNVTSIAMVFHYYGVRSQWAVQLEDELLQWCFNNYGQGSQLEHSVLSALIRAYRFKTSFSTTRRWSEVKSELMNQRPVVLAGDFTASGHILTVIGYNSTGYIVHDPWGNALTGYRNTEGRRLVYSYGYMDSVAGPDGNVWAHFMSP